MRTMCFRSWLLVGVASLTLAGVTAGQLGHAAPQPDAIDALLSAGRYDAALAACVRVAETPGDRDLARFLHQYGLAQRGAGQGRDAAVTFARCVVHEPETVHAVASLIELATLYGIAWDDPVTERRLLELAATRARGMDRVDLARRAESRLRESRNGGGANGDRR